MICVSFCSKIGEIPLIKIYELLTGIHPYTVKENFDLEEYSLSQSTLEQVFLELSKEQELDDFGEEANSSVKWKLLPQEEL